MTFREEFPDFDAETLPKMPEVWKDQSWHNDACPCFNTKTGYIVFIDFADAAVREITDSKRFTVIADPEIHNHNEAVLDTDDWAEVLAFVGHQ